MNHRATVAIVGAGPLGGATAHTLAARYGVREVRLIDEAGPVAAGQALDIQQAGAIERFDTEVVAGDDLRQVVGAAVVILTGPVSGEDGEWSETEGLAVLRRVSALNAHALVVCAGASHRGIVQAGVSAGELPRRRLVGSAPLALVGALRAIIGLELACSSLDVAVSALGVPPGGIVVPWTGALAEGVPLVRRLEAPRLNRLREKVTPLWPPGPYALASAAATLCQAWLVGTTRRMPCYATLQGELGVHDRAAAVEARLDEEGVAGIVDPGLTGHERVQLDSALRTA